MFAQGDNVVLSVDKANRMAICRNHSTTHLLHKALKEVLGTHVAQAGSFVSQERLRFDFSHFEAMTKEELSLVEQKVNNAILDAMPIIVQELPIEEAKKLGATAQFGEKYGDTVRVVSMGDYSMEFCGGTHLHNTAEAGLFKILSEGGVSAGVRRIEAVTGQGVLDYILRKDTLIADTALVLKTNQLNELNIKAESVMNELRDAKSELEAIKAQLSSAKANDMMAGVKHINDIDVYVAQLDGSTPNDLKQLADDIKTKSECCVAVLAANTDDKITFVAMASPKAIEKGVHAGNIIREVTQIAGGKGGGKPDMAQGGGKDSSKIDDALAVVDEVIEKQCK